MLEILVRNPGKLVGQRQILQEVWGPSYGTETNYLRVYLAQIRRKLEPDPARPRPGGLGEDEVAADREAPGRGEDRAHLR